MIKEDTNWLDNLADVKRVGFGDKAEFDVKLNGIRAFVQAKGATTPRTKEGYKKLTMETISVSARPFINIVELQNGLANAADLINKATYQMEVGAATRVSARESSAVETKSTFTVSLEDKSPNAESESPATCAPWKSRAIPSTVTLT